MKGFNYIMVEKKGFKLSVILEDKFCSKDQKQGLKVQINATFFNSFGLSTHRKAVRAAIVLQPLLGITNSLQMVATPDSTNIVYFATWSVVTTFLVSFQGFFASLFYCFLNGEVSKQYEQRIFCHVCRL